MIRRVHIFNQFLWPDGAPTAIYAEQLAETLQQAGCEVTMIGSGGSYRKTTRSQPTVKIIRVNSPQEKKSRGNLLETLMEYRQVTNVFADYIKKEVAANDVVVVTSAPPDTIRLHSAISRQGAIPIYWLQDYYPELLRGLYDYPSPVRRTLGRIWHSQLRKWHRVVKIGANLDYDGENAVVIRNWPTLELNPTAQPREKVALYTGNLGYAHDIGAFVATCKTLKSQEYKIEVRGDGPGMQQLPGWINRGDSYASEEDLIVGLQAAQVHLVAAHPKIQGAVFPSKFWNARATGREIIPSGFAGAMLDEFNLCLQVNYHEHRQAWADLIAQL